MDGTTNTTTTTGEDNEGDTCGLVVDTSDIKDCVKKFSEGDSRLPRMRDGPSAAGEQPLVEVLNHHDHSLD